MARCVERRELKPSAHDRLHFGRVLRLTYGAGSRSETARVTVNLVGEKLVCRVLTRSDRCQGSVLGDDLLSLNKGQPPL